MRIVFCGTSAFAVPSLLALRQSRHEIVLCVTQPERPQGRGLHPAPSPVEQAARAQGLPIFQPDDPSTPESVRRIGSAGADLLVVIAYGCILRRPLLEATAQGAISLHPSLLPRHRGAAPIAWALINGDATTGLSIFRLTERVDDGDLLIQEELAIHPDETAVELSARLAARGATLVVESIDLMAVGRVSYRPQSSAHGSYARKLTKADGRIDWCHPAPAIHHLVRGTQPWPGAQTAWQGRLLVLWRTRLPARGGLPRQAGVGPAATAKAAPGTIVQAAPDGVVVVAGAGTQLIIKEIQAAGSRRMSVADFLRGHRLRPGDHFGTSH